jgi:hypothetical protein
MTIYDIKLSNKQHGQFFFDPPSMRFFDSCIGRETYEGAGGVYFITSEQFTPSNGTPEKRRYTVRKFNVDTGEVDTFGEFQQYGNASSARMAAIKASLGK